MNDRQIKDIFSNYCYIIVDSREKDTHVIDMLKIFNIKYRVQKLDYGDYGIEIQSCEKYGIAEPKLFEFTVERKSGLDEISTNLTKGQKRFCNEMERCKNNNGKMVIVIEDATYDDIAKENYRSNLTAKQFYGLLHGIESKYDILFIFIPKSISPLFIYNYLKYNAREYLKKFTINN